MVFSSEDAYSDSLMIQNPEVLVNRIDDAPLLGADGFQVAVQHTPADETVGSLRFKTVKSDIGGRLRHVHPVGSGGEFLCRGLGDSGLDL